ncbi:MAG: HNH endonuclease [Candidatus Hodarchaeales archaeon]|jgi:5-methylcytosine-specific restriction endonuclease McrA
MSFSKKEYDRRRYEENRDSILERNRKWKENNKDRVKEQEKEYRKKNKDRLKEYYEKWCKENKKYIKGYHKEYYKKNKNSKRESNKRHYEENIDYYNKRLISYAPFATYAHQIEFAEEVSNINGYLEVKCTYCGKWFTPTIMSVNNRISVLNGRTSGESRLYCSNECKIECPIYNKSKYPKGFKPETSREVQAELRQLVFKRDEYECQRCKSIISLHCHHITGVEQNPIESADLDNCITLCKKCHKWAHTLPGCRYFELRGCK